MFKKPRMSKQQRVIGPDMNPQLETQILIIMSRQQSNLGSFKTTHQSVALKELYSVMCVCVIELV